jgi:hypothetical protein
MHSSRENSRKRKNDSDKRGEYQKFDEASSRLRDTLIQSCAERVIAHAASNGGSNWSMSSIEEHLTRTPALPPGWSAPCTSPRGPARTKPTVTRSRQCMTCDAP